MPLALANRIFGVLVESDCADVQKPADRDGARFHVPCAGLLLSMRALNAGAAC